MSSATHVLFKSVQWLVTDTCKWAAAGTAAMDACTLACGSHCSPQWLPSCPYRQWIKISSVRLVLIRADQSAAVEASGPFPPLHPWPTAMFELSSWIERVESAGNWPLPQLYTHFILIQTYVLIFIYVFMFLHSDRTSADINLRFILFILIFLKCFFSFTRLAGCSY